MILGIFKANVHNAAIITKKLMLNLERHVNKSL